MQVRKFEARNMKEALEMVKRNLGPDAVILQARDNASKFGLGGQSSVEVTAAVSETMLRKKRMAEARMTERAREKFQTSPAHVQKQYLQKAFAPEPEKPKFTQMRYADILDDEGQTQTQAPTAAAVSVESALQYEQKAQAMAQSARDRIRMAAQSAWNAGKETVDEPKKPQVNANTVSAQSTAQMQDNNKQVQALQKEIKSLRQIIANFQRMPQSMVTSHPGANEGINFELSPMFEKLTRAGLSVENTVEMLKEAQDTLPKEVQKKLPYVDAWVAKKILESTRVVEKPVSNAKYHVFVGGAGQGKTSSLVKFASHLVIKKKKKIVILSTDSSRVGASEQLKILAQILNVPFANVRTPEEWQKIDTQLKGFDHILVDFPGLQLKSEEEMAFFTRMLPPANSGRAIHYVQSALMKDDMAFDLFNRYRNFGVNDVMFTGLDESSQHGIIYNLQKKFNIPLHSFGIGPNIPEDYELATRERVVDLIFKLTKIKKS